MDANLMSCPKCGHTVSSTGKFCTYCGMAFSENGSGPQVDDKPSDGQPPAMAAPPPLPAQASETVVATTVETAAAPGAAQPAAVDSSAPVEPTPAAPEIVMPEAPDESEAEIEIEMIDPQAVTEVGDYSAPGPQLSAEATTNVASQESGVSAEEAPVQVDGPESLPLTDEAPIPAPPPEIMELEQEDPLESETLGSEIAAMVNAEDSPAEMAQPASADKPVPLQVDAAAANAEALSATDVVPMTAAPEAAIDADAGEVKIKQPDSLAPEGTAEVSKPDTPAVDIQPSADVNQVTSDMLSGDGAAPIENKAFKIQNEAQLAAEAMKIENAAQEMSEAVKQQKVELARAEALQDQKTETAEAGKRQQAAVKQKQRLKEKAIALKRKKAALARAAALKKQKQARAAKGHAKAQNSVPTVHNLPSSTKMLKLLKKYQSQAIGINYDNSAEIREAELVEVNAEFFSVLVKDKQLYYHYPLSTILTVIEGQDGVSLGAPEKAAKFNAVIKVYPLVLF